MISNWKQELVSGGGGCPLSLRINTALPVLLQSAARARSDLPLRKVGSRKFAADSPLEQGGFELVVPL
jgi:hypothetical protein